MSRRHTQLCFISLIFIIQVVNQLFCIDYNRTLSSLFVLKQGQMRSIYSS